MTSFDYIQITSLQISSLCFIFPAFLSIYINFYLGFFIYIYLILLFLILYIEQIAYKTMTFMTL